MLLKWTKIRRHLGRRHRKCATFSPGAAPQCAVKVDEEGEATRLATCREGCAGTSFPCSRADLFNFDGKCVEEKKANGKERTERCDVWEEKF